MISPVGFSILEESICFGIVLKKLPNYANIITCYIKSSYVNYKYRTCGYPTRRTDECICVAGSTARSLSISSAVGSASVRSTWRTVTSLRDVQANEACDSDCEAVRLCKKRVN